MKPTHPHFFGYGSLVNRRTHDYAPVHRATLRGWRRAWRATEARPTAFLTAERDPAATTEGLIAPVPGDDWAALDAREAAYARVDASDVVTHRADGITRVAVYAIDPADMRPPSPDKPVLLSYLDVVIQGFLAEYGRDGAERFFDSTTGWEAPILNDRAAPRYPRTQRLTDDERSVVDAGLARLGCTIL